MLRAFGVIVPTYQPRSNIIFPITRINSRASHLTVASSAMSSQDIVVREPVLLPLEDYLGATPIPHLPLENTDKFYKLYMERDDGILSLYNRPGDANFGHWGGTWCQALPDEADKPPMCQYINESLDNIAPVVLPQERWMRRATDYLTHLCPYEYIQVQCREMMKIWPVDQMPAWVPVLRERWLIVKRAKKENRDAWETWLQRCESSNDESLLQVVRKEREQEARRLRYQELAKVRNRDQLIAKHQARREYVAVVRAAEKEREQQQREYNEANPFTYMDPKIWKAEAAAEIELLTQQLELDSQKQHRPPLLLHQLGDDPLQPSSRKITSANQSNEQAQDVSSPPKDRQSSTENTSEPGLERPVTPTLMTAGDSASRSTDSSDSSYSPTQSLEVVKKDIRSQLRDKGRRVSGQAKELAMRYRLASFMDPGDKKRQKKEEQEKTSKDSLAQASPSQKGKPQSSATGKKGGWLQRGNMDMV